MLGLLLIYFIGKAYYDLAGKLGKHKWGFAIIGIASYYGGAFLSGIIIGIFSEVSSTNFLDDVNDFVLGLIGIPFGLLACWGVYKLIKRKWEKIVFKTSTDILDEGLIS